MLIAYHSAIHRKNFMLKTTISYINSIWKFVAKNNSIKSWFHASICTRHIPMLEKIQKWKMKKYIAGCESKTNTLRSRNTCNKQGWSHGCLGHWVCMLASAARIRLFLWEKKEKVASSLFRASDWSYSWGWDEAVSKMQGDWIWTMCWSPSEMELSVSCRLRKTQAHPRNQETNQSVCWLPDFLKITTETHFVWNYYEIWWRL